jgi:hypothetical protein
MPGIIGLPAIAVLQCRRLTGKASHSNAHAQLVCTIMLQRVHFLKDKVRFIPHAYQYGRNGAVHLIRKFGFKRVSIGEW